MEKIPNKIPHIFDADASNEKAVDEMSEITGNHHGNLYDQNEDRSGETRDLITGKQIDNTLPDDAEHAALQEIIPQEGQRDILPPIEEEEDVAAKWLRDNDPNFKK